MSYTRDNWPQDRWPNFGFGELVCTESGINRMDTATMDRLQRVRSAYGRGMTISSGYRDVTHPIEATKIAKFGNAGAHSTGRAVDIAVRGGDAVRLLQLALAEGFTGIGIQQKGEGRFLHLDDIQPEDEFHVPRPWIWSY